MLSSSVADAMELAGNPEWTSAVEFVRMMDHVFDILNVRAMSAGKRSRNKFAEPVTSRDDWKLTVSIKQLYYQS